VQKAGMRSLRTVLDLEDSSRTNSRGLGLEGPGLGLEHSVPEHIPGKKYQNWSRMDRNYRV